LEDVATTVTTAFELDAEYRAILPGLVRGHKDNEFVVGGNLGTNISIHSSTNTVIRQDVTFAGAGAAGVNAARAESEMEETVDPVVDFDAGVFSSHSFYYDLGPATFAFAPMLSFNLGLNNNRSNSEIVTITRVDGDSDGLFTSAADTITTSTSTTTDDDGGGSTATTTTLTTVLALPIAVKVSPEKWPFSLTLGSEPRMRLRNTITNVTDAGNSTNQTVAVTGTGTAVSDATTENNGSSDTTSDKSHDLSITAAHNIGLSMPIGDFVSLDINLGLSTNATNILDFKDFVMQAIIALP
jgi:hypothetical protein